LPGKTPVIQRTILPVVVLTLTMVACSTQAGLATPSLPAASGAPVSATPSTQAPSSIESAVPSETKAPNPPPLPVLASPALTRIDFQDENNGWGIAINDNGYVLRTVDGGRNWLNATPSETGIIGLSTSLSVVNTNTAWVLVPAKDFFSGSLFRTRDGGGTWTSNPVPFGGGFLQFLDASTGRVLAYRGAAAGSEAVEFFQTSDGGATWASVFHNDPSQPDSSDSLPLSGIKNGMTFLDANTGWVTGSIPANGVVYLYVTHDGGVSWSQQSLPLPTGYASYQYMSQAPVFFGNDGFLPLMIYMSNRIDFAFYSTHDGGLTWSGDPGNANKVIKPGLPAFADALHIWSWNGGTTLYITNNGAQNWHGTSTSLDLSGRLSQLEFVPAPAGRITGWALTRVDDAGHSQLYRTEDGLNWTPLIP
jgi:photosystem II stability/assembly factor-like uncharacterized protein